MRYAVPHPIPYQGSKRQLAPAILSFISGHQFSRFIEPFAGSAAITLAVASANLCQSFLIADALAPLADIWHLIVNDPQSLARRYAQIWRSQLRDPRRRFDEVRGEFNVDHEPAKLLFLLARCVKNSVRFNPAGKFNQSPDNRRLGVKPKTEEKEIQAAHRLLSGRCEVRRADFRETLERVTAHDLVYLDPPYQGTSEGRDRRYFKGVGRDLLVHTLADLNRKGVQFLLSYDGSCGSKTYGEPLPASLGVMRAFIEAGRSSQATLCGKNLRTVESLYVSAGLCEGKKVPVTLHWKMPLQVAPLF